MLLNSTTIAYTDQNDQCLKILDIEKREQLYSIKLSQESHIFAVQEFDYEMNPFAFVKDEEKISLINMRNCKIVKVIDSKYGEWDKQGSLINIRISKEQTEQTYRLFDVQRYDTFGQIVDKLVKKLFITQKDKCNASAKIREITIKLP
ncbi:UNKNOWN [Stylonychia lemnae]|uniref:Uncharacterized protein n=1 Tax=Stylonychia lemnae TaxID=5949 RepID=A0A077ZV48_STYLE|nr:UNKNOWN [Stylonychia lemnae]|eukprot:CDW73484.1 UNKNOWN [Stylonychia lemnae]